MKNNELRLQNVTSRMVGMYRLLTEQTVESYTDPFKEKTKGSRKSFFTLKKHIMSEVYDRLIAPGKVEQVLSDALKERGSLKEMLFDPTNSFPEQTILIRFGGAVSAAIQTYLGNRYTDITDTVAPVVESFLERNIQMDVAVEKDGTYYISELKYNMNLDTEKVAKTVEKLDLLGITLKKFYNKKGINTNVTFVSLRYPYAKDIKKLKPELEAIKNQYILGYVEFFSLFGITINQSDWDKLHRELGQAILDVYYEAYLTREMDIITTTTGRVCSS